jgi:hypothetical protein
MRLENVHFFSKQVKIWGGVPFCSLRLSFFFLFFTDILSSILLQPSPLALIFVNQHLSLFSPLLSPSLSYYPPTLGAGVQRRSPRLEIQSAVLPGYQREAGERGGISAPPALRKNGALPILPFSLPCPRTGPLLDGAVSCSSSHTENVRTTNKISIKLSFVS